MTWGEHESAIPVSCYGTLSVLRRLKNLATFHVRKILTENLVSSTVNNTSNVFHSLPQHQLKRLRRLQNTCAGFLLKKYAGKELNWLSVEKQREMTLLKLTHKAFCARWSERSQGAIVIALVWKVAGV